MQSKFSNQAIHILGPGAMGLLWASHLAEADWDVTLLYKNNPGEKNTTIHYQSSKSSSQFPIKQQSSKTAMAKLNTLIITVKANQLCTALKPLISKINKNTLIILTQNGIGSETEMYSKYPMLRDNLVLQVVTSHSAIKQKQNYVKQTGFGFCWIGPSQKFHSQKNYLPKKNPLLGLLKLNMVDDWRDDIEDLLWQKLIINASINPLAAILSCRNGELLTRSLLPLMKEIVEESSLIARSAGLKDINTLQIFEKVKQVCRDTATNQNSMLVDVINHRPTEIDYINQFLINSANKLNIDAPWNLCLTSILNTINHVKMRT